MHTILDLVCVPPLSCRATLLSSRSIDEIVDGLETLFGGRVYREDDNRLSAQFVEPLELVAAARHFAMLAKNAAELRAFAATPSALEMLRDAAEPTCTSWRWVLDSLVLELPDDVEGPFVAAMRVGYLELSPDVEFLDRPVLALRTRSYGDETCELVDRDSITENRYVEFERDAHGWYIREIRESALHVNGFSVTSPHRLATGDRLRTYSYDYEVIAII